LYAARALGRRFADQPTLLPTGTGPTPLRWAVDPTASDTVDDTNGTRRSAGTPLDVPYTTTPA
jgi:hypothetical protein